jgi:hypothetical protein
MGSFSLVQFMGEGGWGMWPTLVLGAGALGASVRYAVSPDRRRLAFAATLGVSCLVMMAFALMTNVSAVLTFVQDPARVPDAEVERTLLQGMLEASRPGALGGAFLALVSLVLPVGIVRSQIAPPKPGARVAAAES